MMEDPRTPRPEPESPGPRDSAAADPTAVFERLESLLTELRQVVEAGARERTHRRFSATWLIASLLQVFAAALVVLAGLDWVFQASDRSMLVKLAFAAAIQLIALSLFVAARDD